MTAHPDHPELATFLRARRERVTPAEVGLPTGRGHRRTPGLRREELASLAGISVDYLIRLEQGREVTPSSAVVVALADALRLDTDERQHMWSLVVVHAHGEMCPDAVTSAGVDEATLTLLERLEGTPAFVLDPTTEVVAWNRSYDRVVRDLGVLDLDPPSLVRFTFLAPAARRVYPDWHELAREQVGNLRAASTRPIDDAKMAALVGELTMKSDEFARLWAAHDVGAKRTGTKRMVHPAVGEITVQFRALGLPDAGDLRLVTYLPANASSATALARLDGTASSAATPHLRVVDAGA